MSPDIIRCRACRLNQYMPASGNCRRCHKALIPQPIPMLPVIVEQPAANYKKHDIATALGLLRKALGLSQLDLGSRLNTPRTYISKIENGISEPTLKSIQRLSDGLGVSQYFVVRFAMLCAEARCQSA